MLLHLMKYSMHSNDAAAKHLQLLIISEGWVRLSFFFFFLLRKLHDLCTAGYKVIFCSVEETIEENQETLKQHKKYGLCGSPPRWKVFSFSSMYIFVGEAEKECNITQEAATDVCLERTDNCVADVSSHSHQ